MRKTSRWIGVVMAALVLGAAPVYAHGPKGSNPLATFQDAFLIVFIIAVPIFLLVQGLLLFAIVRYRRRSDDEMPKQIHGNAALEWTWTLGSFAIVAFLFVFTVGVLADEPSLPPDALVVEVTGRQFFWEFDYPEYDLSLISGSEEVVKLPARRNVLLRISSADVQHSFWVPEWGGKIDAIPGRVNELWFDFHDTGSYVVRCAEFCGSKHFDMLAYIDVVPMEEFDDWIAEKSQVDFVPIGTDMETSLPEGDALAGEALFKRLGCGGCHNFEGENGQNGPSLLNVGEKAEDMREGYTAEQYIRESILLPNAYIYPGYRPGIMPDDYGDRLSAQELADLIAYLTKAE